jgi:hypothetical protein
VKWNWDTTAWKSSTRLLLGVATIWPIVYIVLFLGSIVSGVFIVAAVNDSTPEHRSYIDLIQLEKKIQNGEIKELRISSSEFEAVDRDGSVFYTYATNKSTREELIGQARAPGANGLPRVAKVEENTSRPEENFALPFAFLVLMGFHMMTMLLLFLMMPVYIILPLKNERLDQNMRIVWVILACTIGVFSDVAYWYLHVWRTPPASSVTPELT